MFLEERVEVRGAREREERDVRDVGSREQGGLEVGEGEGWVDGGDEEFFWRGLGGRSGWDGFS